MKRLNASEKCIWLQMEWLSKENKIWLREGNNIRENWIIITIWIKITSDIILGLDRIAQGKWSNKTMWALCLHIKPKFRKILLHNQIGIEDSLRNNRRCYNGKGGYIMIRK